MNQHVDIETESETETLWLRPDWRVDRRSGIRLIRRSLRALTIRRLFHGGRIDDLGRLPRYAVIACLAVLGLWAPVVAYLELAPLRYTSSVSLILPGSGASSSISLSEIGQASSYANSPYAGTSLSPTVTYRRLVTSHRVLSAAAGRLGEATALSEPRVRLVDQTGLLLLESRGASPEDAQARAAAVTEAFLAELETLRRDEQTRRAESARSAIAEYEAAVSEIRLAITQLQRESGLSSPEQYAEIVSDREALAGRLRDLDARLEETAGQVATLEAALGVDARLASLSLKLQADPEFRALGGAMAAAAADLAAARGEYGERHPVLIAARDHYAGTLARMEARAGRLTGLEIDRLAETIDLAAEGERAKLLAMLVQLHAEASGLAAQRKVLAGKLTGADRRVDTLMEAAARLDDLGRDYQVAEAVFASALARLDTSKADLYASYPLVQILEAASLPDRPSSPRKMIAIAAGVAGTLLLLVALALAWLRRPMIDWMLRKVTSA